MHRLRILLSLLGFILVACKTNPSIGQPDQVALGDTLSLVVVYTNDEHGWMAGEAARQCAPELASSWSDAFGDQDAVLILSGGDNWTGPAISTWFQGESMVEVMTAMVYKASAVGNHEFDFGLDTLRIRLDQTSYPYLAANIRYLQDGTIPEDLGIRPYTIVETGGLQIGLVGLANVDTPSTTNPQTVTGFGFWGTKKPCGFLSPRRVRPELTFFSWPAMPAPGNLRLARDVADLGVTLLGVG